MAAFLLFGKREQFAMSAVRKIFLKQCLGFAGVVLRLMGFYPAAHGAQSLSLAWNASTDKKVVGYCLHYRTAGSNDTARIVLPKKKTKVTIPDLKEGATYYFTITSYDAKGVESLPSQEIPYIVPGVLALSQGTKPGDPARIKFPVAPKHKYDVQASDDMRTWVTIGRVKGVTNSWVEFDDAAAPSHRQRFYRLVLH
jgi:Fibronectin type III domain